MSSEVETRTLRVSTSLDMSAIGGSFCLANFGTFFDGELTWMERGCLRSFLRHGHRVTLYSYKPVTGLPAGIVAADAATILPQTLCFRTIGGPHHGGVAAFSDLFRYAMIRATGLTWIDTDVVCLRRDWSKLPLIAAWQDAVTVNGAVLGGPRDAALFDRAFAVAARVGSHGPWAYTGPFLLTALVHQLGLTGQVQPERTFYPIAYGDAVRFLLAPMPDAKRIDWPQESLTVHLWNEMLRLSGWDKRGGPPEHSLLKLIFADLGE